MVFRHQQRTPRPFVYQLCVDLHRAAGVVDGDAIELTANGMTVQATAHVNGSPQGVALLSGVPYQAGTAVVEIRKLEGVAV